MRRARLTFGGQWAWPAALAVATILALLSALLGQGGVWWWIAWSLLSIPVLIATWCIAKPLLRPRAGRADRRR